MNDFPTLFKSKSDVTLTENGGRAYSTTRSFLLDFFANVGGMRYRSDRDIVNSWLAARKENSELADNAVLYARSVRDGLGERKVGRLLLKELAKINPQKVIKNFGKIVRTGRWDDLFVFEGTQCEKAMFDFIYRQFRRDMIGRIANQPISLLAKWLKSPNTSSKESRRFAKKTCQNFGMSERCYRRTLSMLRQYIDIVERKMSAGEWDSINFEKVPSLAMSRYINTFNKRCPQEFRDYKKALLNGEVKVNTKTLYPYDIVQKFFKSDGLDEVDLAQWENLPNYVDNKYEVVIMADVSGSMRINDCQPLATSVGLATYFAQRNKGAYHGMYLTFTDYPHFITLDDNWGLNRCLQYVENAGVGYNTNLDMAFKAIFDVAVQSHEIPKALVVISDMEIDSWSEDYVGSITEKWAEKYIKEGLKAPKLILWNVESRAGRILSQPNENVAFVSGYGIGSFKNLETLINKTAYEAMIEILSKEEFCWS